MNSNNTPQSESFFGDPALQTKATGFYRLECFAGRWMLVTPDGHPVYSMGINHLAELVKPVWFFDTNWWTDSGGDPNKALQGVLDTTLALGFNSAGCYENTGFFVNNLPFVATLEYPPYEIPSVYNYGFDIFDPEIKARFAESIKLQCAAFKGIENLIGYSFVDQPRYHVGCVSSDHKYAYNRADMYRRMKARVPGKKRYVQFLKDQYSDQIENLNKAYNQSYKSFDTLSDEDFASLDSTIEPVQKDDAEFLGIVAMELYSTLHQAVKEVDDSRLIFSEKFIMSYTPDSVLKAAGKYVDVICSQAIRYLYWMLPMDEDDWRVYPKELMERWYKAAGKPILLADWRCPFDDAPDQEAYRWLMGAAESEFVIGVNRCRILKEIGGENENSSAVAEMIGRNNKLAVKHVYQDLQSRLKNDCRP